MPSHPYLRAYMAGLVAPSIVVCLVGVIVVPLFREIPFGIERAMIFPMAINPAVWGIWNILYVWLGDGRRLPIAWHGALLPLFLLPMGLAVARLLSISFVTVEGTALVTLPTVVAYYVFWKYIVRFLNDLLQIAKNPNESGRQL
jgi:hypothetical protein